MILNTSALAAIFRSFSAIYAQAVEAMQGKPLYQRITTVVPSSAKGNDYGWLGNFPSMREWIGEKIIKNLKAFKYSIENKDWESTISVDRNDILDDSVGVYEPLVKGLAAAAEMHPDELIFGLLPAGFAAGGECYDGQFMFDADHPVGDTTVSNVGTGILNRSNFAAARTGMMSLTDDTGKYLNIRPDLLVVPPQLEAAALEIVGVAKLANGQDNIYYKTVEVLVVPALAGNATKWYLFDTTKPVKPFVFQRRSPNKLVSLTNDADQNVFMKKEFLYSVEARDNAGYGMWQCAYGSTGTT